MQRNIKVALFLLIVLVGCGGKDSRLLKPEHVTRTPAPLEISAEPRTVSFGEISTNPHLYIDQLLRVSGNFTFADPITCEVYKGPPVTWSLIADSLQMDATGYAQLPKLVADGSPMTVDGIWHLYEGPLGCGKEPESQNLWYLEVLHIESPRVFSSMDPVRATTGSGDEVLESSGDDPLAPTTIPEEIAPTIGAAVPPATVVGSDAPTIDVQEPTFTPEPAGTETSGTPTATLDPDTTVTATIVSTRRGTSEPGATVPAGSTATPSATPESGSPTNTPVLPSFGTATPVGGGGVYPGGTPTAYP